MLDGAKNILSSAVNALTSKEPRTQANVMVYSLLSFYASFAGAGCALNAKLPVVAEVLLAFSLASIATTGVTIVRYGRAREDEDARQKEREKEIHKPMNHSPCGPHFRKMTEHDRRLGKGIRRRRNYLGSLPYRGLRP